MKAELRKEFEALVKKYTLENANTFDWVLADYLKECIKTFDLYTDLNIVERKIGKCIETAKEWESRSNMFEKKAKKASCDEAKTNMIVRAICFKECARELKKILKN